MIEEKTQINFLSKQKTGTSLFLDLGNGAFVEINPQSAINIQKTGTNVIMQIIEGNVEY